MSNINKYTTKEVLNKVLLDSSGDAVNAYSHTSQEALNTALDATNNRLNVSLKGGTISGDVTINGDLTVNGDGSGNYDEIVDGNLVLTSGSKLGIGMGDATVSYPLHVQDQVDGNYIAYFKNTDADNGYGVAIDAGDDANVNALQVRTVGGSNLFVVNGAGNATLGSSADEKLMLKGSNNPYIRFYESTSAKAYIQWHSDGYMQLENSETGTTLKLADSVTISDASSGSPKLILYNSNTSGSQSSHLDFQQASTSQADDQQLGYVSFSGYRDNDSSIETVVSMAAFMSDITTADSAGEFRLQVHIDNSASNVLNINGFDGGVGQGSIVFNEDSKDFDFRVESDNNANAFFIEGSTGNTAIGTTSPSSLFHVTSSTADGHIIAESTHAGSNGVVDIRSVADRDSVIHFREGTTVKARIKNDASADALVLTDGADSDTVFIKSNNVGIGVSAPDQKMIIGHTGGVVLNIISDTDANSADNDALIKFSTDGATESASTQKGTIGYDQGDDIFTMGYGDNQKHLNINSSGNVGIGNSTSDVMLTLSKASTEGQIIIRTHTADNAGSALKFQKSRNTTESGFTIVSDGDYLGSIEFQASDSNSFEPGAAIRARINGTVSDGSATPTDLIFLTSSAQSYVERMRILSSGNVGIGVSAPEAQLNIAKAGSSDNATFNIDTYSSGDSSQSIIGLRKASSNSVSTKTLVVDNEKLGKIAWYGADGDDFDEAASIHAEIDGTPFSSSDDTDMPGALVFGTTADGTGSTAERMRIDSSGNVGINNDSPDKMLHLKSSGSESPCIKIENNNDDQYPPRIQFVKDVGNDAEADYDQLGSISFRGQDTNNNLGTFTQILGKSLDVTDSTEDGQLIFNVMKANDGDGVQVFIDPVGMDVYGTPLKVFGTNVGHETSALCISQDTSDLSQIRAYGADDSNAGTLEFRMTSSAGAVNKGVFKLDSNSRISLSNNDGNTYNTVFGSKAFTDTSGNVLGNVGADYNVAIGHEAMGTTGTTGAAERNVAVGYLSLRTMIDGDDNTAIGANAATALRSGLNNTVVGSAAFDAAGNDESDNVVIGYGAMGAAKQDGTASATNREVKQNVAIGTDAMKSGIIGGTSHLEANVAIGYQAMDGTGTAGSIESVAIGLSALGGSWGGNCHRNIGIGAYVMDAAMSDAQSNIGMGTGALGALTTGDCNIALGAYLDGTYNGAMATSTTGINCIAIGTGALQLANHTASDGSIAIGFAALRELAPSSGSQYDSAQTAIGHLALTSTTSGTQNTAVGFQCLYSNTTGLNNTALGHKALRTNVDGDNNVAIGSASLYTFEASSDGDGCNTAVGANSGYLVSTGQDNVLIGENAGWINGGTSLTTGSGNTLVGYQAAIGAAGASNRTAIGNGATAQADNSVTLGNASVTAVYMGQDSGARIFAERLDLKRATEMCSLRMSTFDTAADTASTIYLQTSNHDTADNYAAVDANDILGQVFFDGSDGDSIESGGTIRCTAAETWDSDSRGTTFTLALVPSGANSTTLTTRIAIDGSGELSADLNDTSDVNLKENVKTINDGLSIVKQINPVTFDWKEKSKGSNSGFIAQEIEKLLPNDVSGEDYITPKDGEQAENMGKSINVTGIVAHLVKAVQELTAKVEALESKG